MEELEKYYEDITEKLQVQPAPVESPKVASLEDTYLDYLQRVQQWDVAEAKVVRDESEEAVGSIQYGVPAGVACFNQLQWPRHVGRVSQT